jgi:hypothetical protein
MTDATDKSVENAEAEGLGMRLFKYATIHIVKETMISKENLRHENRDIRVPNLASKIPTIDPPPTPLTPSSHGSDNSLYLREGSAQSS